MRPSFIGEMVGFVYKAKPITRDGSGRTMYCFWEFPDRESGENALQDVERNYNPVQAFHDININAVIALRKATNDANLGRVPDFQHILD